MNKNKKQATEWETNIVKRARKMQMGATRLPEGGIKDIGDVVIRGVWKDEPGVTAVLWKRLLPSEGERRQPDGEREVAILTVDDFLLLLRRAESNAIIEAKAAQRINVTRTLAKARKKAENYDYAERN